MRRVARARERSLLRASLPLILALTLGGMASDACARRGATRANGVANNGEASDHDSVPSAVADTLNAPIREDSVRGVVRVVGAMPGNLTLRPATGGPLDLMGEELPTLRAADGLEVALFGQFGPASGVTTSTAGFVITRFAVRSVDGDAAIDGVLERTGDGYVLRLADGARLSLAAVPEPLRTAIGMRVFWVGPIDTAPRAYGILGASRPPR